MSLYAAIKKLWRDTFRGSPNFGAYIFAAKESGNRLYREIIFRQESIYVQTKEYEE